MSEEQNLTTWVKPNGTKIQLNDLPATVKTAEANGWKREGEEDSGDQPLEKMSAGQLKGICKDLGIDYEGKKEAVEAIKALQTDPE